MYAVPEPPVEFVPDTAGAFVPPMVTAGDVTFADQEQPIEMALLLPLPIVRLKDSDVPLAAPELLALSRVTVLPAAAWAIPLVRKGMPWARRPVGVA